MFVQDACHEGARVRWARGFRSHLIHPAQRVFGPVRSPRIGNRAAYSGKVNADSGRSRQGPMLSTDIAPVFYRSIRGRFPATRTMDIAEQRQTSRNNHTQCNSRKR